MPQLIRSSTYGSELGAPPAVVGPDQPLNPIVQETSHHGAFRLTGLESMSGALQAMVAGRKPKSEEVEKCRFIRHGLERHAPREEKAPCAAGLSPLLLLLLLLEVS